MPDGGGVCTVVGSDSLCSGFFFCRSLSRILILFIGSHACNACIFSQRRTQWREVGLLNCADRVLVSPEATLIPNQGGILVVVGAKSGI